MVTRSSRRPGCVSVVVPAFNAERGLKRCIDSVLAQTHPDRDVTVVNDGSTDATGQIAGSYGDRIRLITQTNLGEGAARNAGFSHATGEFITFVDHDDYWEPELLETCVGFLAKHPEIGAVSTGSDHRSALSAKVRYMPAFLEATPRAGEGTPLESFFDFWARHDHVCAGSVVLRGSLFDEAGGQREDLALSGDLEYWGYLATFGRWGFIPRVLLHVDGTQSSGPGLYDKFHRRYLQCAGVADWESRIAPRLKAADRAGFKRVRARVATWYVFAKVFVGRDLEAYEEAQLYRDHLDGSYGRLWRASLAGGMVSWKVMATLLRARIRAQYRRSGLEGRSGG